MFLAPAQVLPHRVGGALRPWQSQIPKHLKPRRRKRRLEEYKRSNLVEKMITVVGRGQVSVAGAAELARCAVSDGLLTDAVRAFSSWGASGSSPSNCERDMTRWLRRLFQFDLEPYPLTLHLQVLPANKIEMLFMVFYVLLFSQTLTPNIPKLY